MGRWERWRDVSVSPHGPACSLLLPLSAASAERFYKDSVVTSEYGGKARCARRAALEIGVLYPPNTASPSLWVMQYRVPGRNATRYRAADS